MIQINNINLLVLKFNGTRECACAIDEENWWQLSIGYSGGDIVRH